MSFFPTPFEETDAYKQLQERAEALANVSMERERSDRAARLAGERKRAANRRLGAHIDQAWLTPQEKEELGRLRSEASAMAKQAMVDAEAARARAKAKAKARVKVRAPAKQTRL